MKKTILGAIISFVLVLWLFRGVNWEEVWKPLQNVHWTYICLYLAIMLILQFLRSYRWELLLRPIVSVGQKTLFSVTSVGFLALLVLPARGGEFARPYLLSRKAPISMSAALATIVVERILDILTIFIFLIVVSFSEALPQWISRAGYIAMALMGAILFVLFWLIRHELTLHLIAERVLKPFPQRAIGMVRNCIYSFGQGTRILIYWQVMAKAFLFSLVLWSGVALLNYTMFLAFSFTLSLTAAYVLVIIVDLGLMVPSAPGFGGIFQFLCVVSLALFGIGKEESLSFSILLHILQILFVVGLGLGFLPMMKMSGFSFSRSNPQDAASVSK